MNGTISHIWNSAQKRDGIEIPNLTPLDNIHFLILREIVNTIGSIISTLLTNIAKEKLYTPVIGDDKLYEGKSTFLSPIGKVDEFRSSTCFYYVQTILLREIQLRTITIQP